MEIRLLETDYIDSIADCIINLERVALGARGYRLDFKVLRRGPRLMELS